jgi:hypothetical protein
VDHRRPQTLDRRSQIVPSDSETAAHENTPAAPRRLCSVPQTAPSTRPTRPESRTAPRPPRSPPRAHPRKSATAAIAAEPAARPGRHFAAGSVSAISLDVSERLRVRRRCAGDRKRQGGRGHRPSRPITQTDQTGQPIVAVRDRFGPPARPVTASACQHTLQPTEPFTASTTPAATHRRIICSPRQRLTLRFSSRVRLIRRPHWWWPASDADAARASASARSVFDRAPRARSRRR